MLNLKSGHLLILYIIILVFGIPFFIYFFRQASLSGLTIESMEIFEVKSKFRNEDLNINLDLFKNEKFKRLREVGVPTSKFDTGKRNPFENN